MLELILQVFITQFGEIVRGLGAGVFLFGFDGTRKLSLLLGWLVDVVGVGLVADLLLHLLQVFHERPLLLYGLLLFIILAGPLGGIRWIVGILQQLIN